MSICTKHIIEYCGHLCEEVECDGFCSSADPCDTIIDNIKKCRECKSTNPAVDIESSLCEFKIYYDESFYLYIYYNEVYIDYKQLIDRVTKLRANNICFHHTAQFVSHLLEKDKCNSHCRDLGLCNELKQSISTCDTCKIDNINDVKKVLLWTMENAQINIDGHLYEDSGITHLTLTQVLSILEQKNK